MATGRSPDDYRRRAKELRAEAERTIDPTIRNALLKLAADFERKSTAPHASDRSNQDMPER